MKRLERRGSLEELNYFPDRHFSHFVQEVCKKKEHWKLIFDMSSDESQQLNFDDIDMSMDFPDFGKVRDNRK